jgi:hypothetical protein
VKDDTRVRWARFDSLIVFMNCCHSWCLCGSRVSCCRSIFLAILYIDSNLCGTIGYGYGLFVVFKHRNSTFIMLYLVHEIDIDYLVVA